MNIIYWWLGKAGVFLGLSRDTCTCQRFSLKRSFQNSNIGMQFALYVIEVRYCIARWTRCSRGWQVVFCKVTNCQGYYHLTSPYICTFVLLTGIVSSWKKFPDWIKEDNNNKRNLLLSGISSEIETSPVVDRRHSIKPLPGCWREIVTA